MALTKKRQYENNRATVALRGILTNIIRLAGYKTDSAEGAQFARFDVIRSCRALGHAMEETNGRPSVREAIEPVFSKLFPEVTEVLQGKIDGGDESEVAKLRRLSGKLRPFCQHSAMCERSSCTCGLDAAETALDSALSSAKGGG